MRRAMYQQNAQSVHLLSSTQQPSDSVLSNGGVMAIQPQGQTFEDPLELDPRRRSFLERLRQNISPQMSNSFTTKGKSSEDEKMLMRNVKDMLRQGYGVSQVTKVAAHLLGTDDEMEVDNTPVLTTGPRCNHGQRRHRQSVHADFNSPQVMPERRARRVNSLGHIRSDYNLEPLEPAARGNGFLDSASQAGHTHAVYNQFPMQNNATMSSSSVPLPYWNQRSNEFNNSQGYPSQYNQFGQPINNSSVFDPQSAMKRNLSILQNTSPQQQYAMSQAANDETFYGPNMKRTRI